jgi:hypothetical protein
MKGPYSYLLLPFVLVGLTITVVANCVPSYDQVLLWYSGCMEDRTIYKKEQNHVTFPDGIDAFQDTEGFGCCHGVSDDLKCEPEFHTPVTSDGRWEQLVRDQSCSSGTPSCPNPLCCSPLNGRLYWLERDCCTDLPVCNFPEVASIALCCCLYQGSCPASPIIIDVAGDGFSMSDAAGGVDFDISGDGTTQRYS